MEVLQLMICDEDSRDQKKHFPSSTLAGVADFCELRSLSGYRFEELLCLRHDIVLAQATWTEDKT